MAVAGDVVLLDIVSVGRRRMMGCGPTIVTVVLVVADVEVEVEESRAEHAMSVPITDGVQSQSADGHEDGHAQCQP
jgi:hypothetical protein